MKVAVIQSNYVPWRGYFDFIASVDRFVVYDDVQYSPGTWRNRNRIKCAGGLRWLTVPVRHSLGAAIDEVGIGHPSKPWRDEHRRILEQSLSGAPFFEDAMAIWSSAISAGDEYLSALNIRLMRGVCDYLGIATPVIVSRTLGASGAKTERLLHVLKAVGATSYLSGPSAKAYLDVPMLESRGIAVEYKTYDYPPYPQQWGAFEGAVSILDLIANTGADARSFLSSTTPSVPALESCRP
jgi:hypothetical protein